ncbi:MAG: polyprenyl synthetase family protein [Planctomycetota bacterium]
MNRIVEGRRMATAPLDELYAPIADELDEVEEILRREMRSDYAYVNELIRYGSLLGGKRLRPALLMLAAKSMGKVTDRHLNLAAVVEMIHTATLVHDDVLDEAMLRRYVATVNARWDNKASLLLGDFLFSQAFCLATAIGPLLACQLIGRSTRIVCEGEIRQKGKRGDFSLSEPEYLEILNAKTAELYACSCRLGAQFVDSAGAEEIESLAQYGRCLGIAFQISDDLLDIAGSEKETGKSLGTDLMQQKPTLPLIRALKLASPTQREQLLDWLRGQPDGEVKWLRHYLQQCGALDYAKQKSREFAQRAIQQLASIPASPATASLRKLGEFVVARSH